MAAGSEIWMLYRKYTLDILMDLAIIVAEEKSDAGIERGGERKTANAFERDSSKPCHRKIPAYPF